MDNVKKFKSVFETYVDALHELERSVVDLDPQVLEHKAKMQEEIRVYGEATESSENKLMRLKTTVISKALNKASH